jgi:hypothetical protein
MPFKRVYVKKTKPGLGSWDETKKLEVVQAYILVGQLRLAAATCNVPESTVKVWRATQWWRDTESELRRSSKLQLSAKLSAVVDKATDVLKDRVDNGDYVAGKEWIPPGQNCPGYFKPVWNRKPIPAETANKITTQLIDRTLMLEKAATKDTIDDAGLDARLKKLKQELIGFAKKPQLAKLINEEEVIDADQRDFHGSETGNSAVVEHPDRQGEDVHGDISSSINSIPVGYGSGLYSDSDT